MEKSHPENHDNDPFFPRDSHVSKIFPENLLKPYPIDFKGIQNVVTPGVFDQPIYQTEKSAALDAEARKLNAETVFPPVVVTAGEPDKHFPDLGEEPDTRTEEERFRDTFKFLLENHLRRRQREFEEQEVPDQKSLFIVFEGPDGSGKTTQAQKLYDLLRSWNLPVFLTREPGGTEFGWKIRDILMDREASPKSRKAELLLFLADRAEHVETVIKPKLVEGYIVICDRFHASTVAYQGCGHKEQVNGHPKQIHPGMIESLSMWSAEDLVPNVTYFLNIDPKDGLDRARARMATTKYDTLDLAYHERVHWGFMQQMREAHRLPDEFGQWVHLDASWNVDQVYGLIADHILKTVVDFGYLPEV